MMRTSLPALCLLAILAAPAVATETAASGQLEGKVVHDSAPLAQVTVYAYELAQLDMHKVLTDGQGHFLFAKLPAGIYKLIAFKSGFDPAVVMLSRAATEAEQFVEMRLQASKQSAARSDQSYWQLREKIPPDVLRDIQTVQLNELNELSIPSGQIAGDFSGALQATTGITDFGASGQATLSGAGVGMEGHIGALQVGVKGEFWRLAAGSAAASSGDGQATTLAVHMQGSGSGQLDLTNVSQPLLGGRETVSDAVADFSRYRVSWSQPIGERSHSRFAAQYTSQNNYFPTALPDPAQVPQSSRSLNLEGAYRIQFSDRATMEAGMRFRELDSGLGFTAGAPSDRALEVFGQGGWRLRPSVLVEYGLYTQLRDGSLALAPQGNVVVQLSPHWQAITSASQRVEQGPTLPLPFITPVRYAAGNNGCQDLDRHCYRVLLARQGDHDSLFSVGAVDREVADSLQLYFNDDFFNQLESLYLVRGDDLPEMQLVVQRQITPRVVARLQSSYSEGGGGVLYALDRSSYENQVRYLVTSLDTQFQHTSTGVFVAFHHLEQDFTPMQTGSPSTTALDVDRLQLMLSQDLNALVRMAADWSVHLDFEVSRGTPLYAATPISDSAVRRRITGGVSIKF